MEVLLTAIAIPSVAARALMMAFLPSVQANFYHVQVRFETLAYPQNGNTKHKAPKYRPSLLLSAYPQSMATKPVS